MHHTILLKPLLPTFVPAGFVDVGHSVVRDASSGENLVIVDSVQSLANHLEATLVAEPGQAIDGLEAMPYVRLTITDPAGTPQFWCHSTKLEDSGQKLNHVAETRTPAAHNVSSSTVDEFLDPSDDGDHSNDNATLNSSAGLIEVFEYTPRIGE